MAQGKRSRGPRGTRPSRRCGGGRWGGYDVASFELDGSPRFIEVKTTKGGANTDFFISANEVEFASRHGGAYYLYRLYDFDPTAGSGSFYVRRGALSTDAFLELQGGAIPSADRGGGHDAVEQHRDGPVEEGLVVEWRPLVVLPPDSCSLRPRPTGSHDGHTK